MELRFINSKIHQPLGRREFLRVGIASTGLLRLDPLAASDASRRPRGFGKAKSVIFVYASGGQSQLDMWDPKPDAPAEVRGEFESIATAVPGVRFSEHMPQLAGLADRFSVVRSMSHEDLDHGTASYLALTGRYHRLRSANPPPSPLDLPTYGAVLKRVRTTNRFLFESVHVNGPALVPRLISPGQDGGILGRGFEPLVVGDVTGRQVAIPGFEATLSLPPVRMAARQSLKSTLDDYVATLSEAQQARELSGIYDQALEILSLPRYRQAFDLSKERSELRDRYGRHRSGQSCLLARRLVEAGVPWVTVIWNHSNRGQDDDPNNTNVYGWDTHNDIFDALKYHLLPRFDASLSALLIDLEQRGLLDETLVVCMGEFGRAPSVAFEERFAGRSPGRKHWASVYSIAAAGAGVQRGAVIGSSDRWGAEPASERYGPWDVAATMFSSLGIDHAGHYRDELDRPYPITVGHPVEALYG